jgi:hypothetical protein
MKLFFIYQELIGAFYSEKSESNWNAGYREEAEGSPKRSQF